MLVFYCWEGGLKPWSLTMNMFIDKKLATEKSSFIFTILMTGECSCFHRFAIDETGSFVGYYLVMRNSGKAQ